MKRFALIGAGRAGPSLAVALRAAGWVPSFVWSRTQQRAEEVAELLGCEPAWGEEGLREAGAAELVLVAVVDDAIASLSRTLSEFVSADAVVLHTSGSTPSNVMKEQGVRAACGSLHPLAALPDIVLSGEDAALSRLRGATCGIEGEARAVALATEMATAVGALPVPLETGGKTLYHGAAVLLSNYLITLFDAATTMVERAGVERAQGRSMLFELARGALDNASASEPWDALTGPVQRGDAATVEAHLTALRREGLEEIETIYRALLLPTVRLARRAGLGAEDARKLGLLAMDEREGEEAE